MKDESKVVYVGKKLTWEIMRKENIILANKR